MATDLGAAKKLAASLVDDPLISVKRLAHLTDTTPSAIRARLHRGDGPAAIRMGRMVRFRQSEVDRWLAEREKASATT
jgi:predicted DNA-binding transcriptional regulator AlpA